MNISQALTSAYQKLIKAKIDSAHLDAELLLSSIIKKNKEHILAHPEKNLTKNQIKKFQNLITQRAKNIPVAYLTNQKEFYGRKFYVDERVLVPRPETEQIINALTPLSPLPQGEGEERKRRSEGIIVDVGTGSGCIIITLAKEFENLKSKILNLKLIAVDISKDALAVARKNTKLHGVNKKIKFLHGNLLEPVYNLKLRTDNLIITANLPYLTPEEIKNSPSIKHEPKLALTAGRDGLKYYRELAEQIQQLCHCESRRLGTKQSRHKITLLCEIGDKQVSGMKKIFSFAKSVKIKKDLAGLNRVVVVKI